MPLPLFLYVCWECRKRENLEMNYKQFYYPDYDHELKFQFKEKDLDCAFLLTYCCVWCQIKDNSCKIQLFSCLIGIGVGYFA